MKPGPRKDIARSILGLSRVPHSLMDVALPAFCAIAWLGAFPSIKITLLGIITASAAYLAVYGFNDLVDLYNDREKAKLTTNNHQGYIDAMLPIHPIASGKLSFKIAFIWICSLILIALIGAYALNPMTIWFFGLGIVCEIAYCFLFKKSAWRILLSGIVKTCGPMAAVFAVDSTPNLALLALLFISIFFWEIGGQNIPADWVDIEQDKAISAKTFPIQYGEAITRFTIMSSLILSIITMLWFLTKIPLAFGAFCLLITFICESIVLLIPAYNTFKFQDNQGAVLLFNRASYYPICLFSIIILHTLIFLHN